MSPSFRMGPRAAMSRRHRRSLGLAWWMVVVLAVVLAGCGSSGSASHTGGSASPTPTSTSTSTTAFCASLAKLESSVKTLPSISDIKTNGTSALTSAVSQIKTDANAVVTDAKSQFATQTTALKNSVDTLSTSVQQLAKSPSTAQLAALPAQFSAVVSSATQLKSAAASSCG